MAKKNEGTYTSKSFFEWGYCHPSSIQALPKSHPAFDTDIKDKEDLLYCICGSGEVRLYTKEDSKKFEDVVVVCPKCGLVDSLDKVVKETSHSA